MKNSEITGWGKCMPPNVLSNHDLEQLVDTSDEWITTRTGIKERRISHVETSDMAAIAGLRALAAAGKKPEDVDLLLVATCTPDSLIPSTASIVQKKIGAFNCAAMDLNAACSGFVYGLVVASGMIRAGTSQTVLLVGAEKLHYVMDFTDRTTCVLFGDGAGAVVLEVQEGSGTLADRGLLSSHLRSDGSHKLKLYVDGGPSSTGTVGHLRMEGREVFKHAVGMISDVIHAAFEATGTGPDDIDWFVPHQANQRIIDASAKKLGIASEKVVSTVAQHGNTSAASVPLALHVAVRDGRIKPGNLVMLEAMGGGFTWAAALLRW